MSVIPTWSNSQGTTEVKGYAHAAFSASTEANTGRGADQQGTSATIAKATDHDHALEGNHQSRTFLERCGRVLP